MSFNPQFEKIGDILLYAEVISQDQLNVALDEQKTSRNKIGHILIKNGAIPRPVELPMPKFLEISLSNSIKFFGFL